MSGAARTSVLLALRVLLCVYALTVPPFALEAGSQAAPPPVAPSPSPPSATIPLPDVAVHAAQTTELLRRLSEAASPGPDIEAIRRHLPELRERIDGELAVAKGILEHQPTLDLLQSQQQLWQQRQAESAAWLATLTRRATLVQDTLARLADLRQRWHHTHDAAQAASAPPSMLAQI